MSFLPTGTLLGRLEIEDVFLEYDGPKLFAARNGVGQRFVAVAVDEDADDTLYLYLPVSGARYLAVRSGLVSLHDAFVGPEDQVYVVRSNHASGACTVSEIDSAEIPGEWLPDPEALLELPTHTRAEFQPVGLQARADGEVRSLLALCLDRPDLMRTEYPLRDLGELLEDVQEAVHAMAAEAEDKATATGSIPEYIVRDSELSLVDLQAASFVVVLAPTLGDRMVEMPLAGVATDRLLSLIASTDDESEFREAVAGLQKRAFSKFQGLLEDLVDTNASLRMYFANPGKEIRETGVTPDQASRGLEILSEVSTTSKQVNIDSAVLIGANVRTRAFELRDDLTNNKYSGRVERDALPQIDGLQLGEAFRYSARVVVEESYGSSSSEPKVVHRLQAIRRMTGDTQQSPFGLDE